MTHDEEILEIVREIPDISISQIAELMSHLKPWKVRSLVDDLVNRGLIIRVGKALPHGRGGGYNAHSISTEPAPAPPAPKLKLVKATETGLVAQIESMRVQIAELTAWKTQALERFPDLATDPLVLQARQIAANRVDPKLREDILAGRKDQCPIMLVALDALGWREAA